MFLTLFVRSHFILPMHLLVIFLPLFFLHANAFIFTTPCFENNNNDMKFSVKCDGRLTNPKQVINPYRQKVENYVQSKPFSSICLKCNTCLAIAAEVLRIFKETSGIYGYHKQEEIVTTLKQKLDMLCNCGFENYDLRKFEHYTILTENYKSSTHARSKMDGKWTEKLRDVCSTYSHHMDLQYLLNVHLKGENDFANYLCRSSGIFRDCSGLNCNNSTSLDPVESKCSKWGK